jgi:hypothetical protein
MAYRRYFHEGLPAGSCSRGPNFPHIYDVDAQVIKAAANFSAFVSEGRCRITAMIDFSEFGDKVK